jgi:dolichol-phosphate mannosyltransferase
MSIAVVIAAYDEELTIEPLTRRLVAALTTTGQAWRLIYVVEGEDRTATIVTALACKQPEIELIYQREPRGFAAAFRTGFAAVPLSATRVVTMDADLNHQPEELGRLLAVAAANDLDIVVGSRFVPGASVLGTPLWKRSLSTTMNVAIRHLFGVRVLDKTSGYRIYRAATLRALLPATASRGFELLPELLVAAERAGASVKEEPIQFVFRRDGKSKMPIGATVLGYLRLLAGGLRTRSATRTSGAKVSASEDSSCGGGRR